jgi:hypothetical protein
MGVTCGLCGMMPSQTAKTTNLSVRGFVLSDHRNRPVPGVSISTDHSGTTTTTDQGEFVIDNFRDIDVGLPVIFRVKDWVVYDPNVGQPGRVYLPSPKMQEPMQILVARPGDKVLLLSKENIKKLIFERFFRFDQSEEEAVRVTTGHLINVSIAGPLSGVDHEKFLSRKSAELGISVSEISLAIKEWGAEVGEPYSAGLFAIYSGDYKEAVTQIRISLDTKEDHFSKYVILSRSALELEDYQLAEQSMRNAIALAPSDPILLKDLTTIEQRALVPKGLGVSAH